MGRISLNDVDKYQGNARGFFTLRDDKDVASVRFLYETEDDVDVISVHRVGVNGQDRYVNCLRDNPDDPVELCPLCASGNGRVVRIFMQLAQVTKFDEKTKDDVAWEAKVWDRGPQFVKKLQSICKRYNPLCGTMFEVERQGKKGDSQTDYALYPIKSDGLALKSLPERKDIIGSVVLDKTYDELDCLVVTGQFPDANPDEEDVKPRGGRSEEHSENRRGQEQPVSRRGEVDPDIPFEGRRGNSPEPTSEQNRVNNRRRV